MEQMVIYSRTGAVKYELPSTDPIYSPTAAKLQRQHMANDYVQVSLQTNDTLTLAIGDWIEVRGNRYSIRSQSDITRTGEDTFSYSITFYGKMYDLMRYRYRNTAIDGCSAQNTFDLTFSLKDFINVIVNNVMRAESISESDAASSPWLFDEASCPETSPVTMSFDKLNCLTAIQNICEQFDVEFLITQALTAYGWQCTIHVGQFGSVVNNTPFEYGHGSGLYQLQETKVDDSSIVNRLWAEGSTENILSGYRGYSMRLQLPRKGVPRTDDTGCNFRRSKREHTITINGEKYIFAAGYPIGINTDDDRYVDEDTLYAGSNDPANGWWKKEGDANWHYAPFNPSGLVTNYGPLESSEVFDDIKPSPTFKVIKPLSTNSRFAFFCSVDFDLDGIWTDTYSDFREWCLLKTQLTPTEAQYNACKTVYDNNGGTYDEDASLWEAYRIEIGDGTATVRNNPYAEWRQQHHSASAPSLPTLPADYNQVIYAEYTIFRNYLVSSTNSKYLIDGGQVAFIDGKLAGLDFSIAEGGFKFYSEFSSAERSEVLFSSSKTYAIGDYCIRLTSGVYKPYCFTSAHTGAWNSSHVSEAPFGLVTINKKVEEDTQHEFPSEDEFGAFRIAPNDTFKLVGIYFPYSYYEDAEEDLWFAAYEKFESVKMPAVQYKLTFDQIFVSENKAIFEAILPGDYISITDDRFGLVSKKMRVLQVDCNLLNNTEYQITLENIHKNRVRSGLSVVDSNEIWRALAEASIDDPHFLRNNRNSGDRVLSFLTANGSLRGVRIADDTIATRMIADQAINSDKLGASSVTAAKIANGSVTETKIADGSVTANKIPNNTISQQKLNYAVSAIINLVPIIQRFANDGTMLDRHHNGTIEFDGEGKILEVKDCVITDSLSKLRLGSSMNNWAAANVSFDFSDGYDADAEYYLCALLKEDGSSTLVLKDSGEDLYSDNSLFMGTITAEIDGQRSYIPQVGETYIENGALKDSAGNVVLDIRNGIMKGELQIDGLKDGNGYNTDILSILGRLPNTAGGLRKLVADATETIGDNNSGLVKKTNDLGQSIGDVSTAGSILYRIKDIDSATVGLDALKSAINTLKSQLNGISYEDCAAQACKRITIPNLPWE